MAASAILGIGQPVDRFRRRETEAFIQFGLVRIGFELGSIDGVIGPKTRTALEEASIEASSLNEQALAVDTQLRLKYPLEYDDAPEMAEDEVPEHLIQ